MVIRYVWCKRCGTLVETEAHHQLYCKSCSIVVSREKAKLNAQKSEIKEHKRLWRLKNRKRLLEYDRKWREGKDYDKIRRARPDVKLKLREYVRRPDVKLRQRKTTKKWRENNQEYARELDTKRKNWRYQNDSEYRKKANFWSAQRRARKKFVKEDFTFDEWWNKILKSNGVCSGCNKDVGVYKITMDHNPSLFKAYLNYLKTNCMTIYTINDVDTLCRSCNSKKGE